jgi:hypothetical protein
VKTRRTRLIALQTLLSAILVGVVAVTILMPDRQNALFGVEVPGVNRPVAQGPPSYERGPGRGQGAHGAGHGSRGQASAGGGAGSYTAPAPLPGEQTVPAPLTRPPGEQPAPPGPPSEQYEDTLARLTDTVN